MKTTGMFRGLLFAAATVAIAAALAPDSCALAAQVTIDNFTFSPAEITVKPGESVTFVNHDDIPHSVVGRDGRFRSKTMDTDDTFVFTPTTPGEFPYFCGLHPHMTGKIIVAP